MLKVKMPIVIFQSDVLFCPASGPEIQFNLQWYETEESSKFSHLRSSAIVWSFLVFNKGKTFPQKCLIIFFCTAYLKVLN